MAETGDRPMSRWAQRKEAKANMYLTSTEGNKVIRRSQGGGGSGQQCQKCLKTGHWTYECKAEPIYISRASKTKELKNPKLRKFHLELPPDELEKKLKQEAKEKAQNKLAGKKKKTKKKKEETSSSESSSSSDSSDSESSSSSGSSDSESESESGSSSSSASSSSSESDSSSDSSTSGSDSDSSSSEDERPAKKRARKSS